MRGGLRLTAVAAALAVLCACGAVPAAAAPASSGSVACANAQQDLEDALATLKAGHTTAAARISLLRTVSTELQGNAETTSGAVHDALLESSQLFARTADDLQKAEGEAIVADVDSLETLEPKLNKACAESDDGYRIGQYLGYVLFFGLVGGIVWFFVRRNDFWRLRRERRRAGRTAPPPSSPGGGPFLPPRF